jgi:hypothetical protein
VARYTGPRIRKSRRMGQLLDDNAVRLWLTHGVAAQLPSKVVF